MKQLLVLSGKGGTGKTTVSSALIALSGAKAFADCDVDAPNLHLVTAQDIKPQTSDYYGFQKAYIDSEKCIKCGLCEKVCRFNAIHDFAVNVSECEGCAVCSEICPVHAIKMLDFSSGKLILHKNEHKVFSTAKLKTGSGASGKLVTAVKKQLKDNSDNSEFAIIDGSPGIGCPVIASISGVNMVLIVAEPTVSGIHDMKRIIETAKKFGTKCAVCINKYDVNKSKSDETQEYCNSIDIKVLGRIPYDKTVSHAVNNCRSIAEYPKSSAAKAIAEIWAKIKNILFKGEFIMKIATASEGKMVTEHFGHCEGFNIFDTGNGKITGSEFVPNPGHRPGFLPVFLADKGVKVIISGGMGQGAIDIFNEKGIEVIVGASGVAEDAVNNYLLGKLKSTGSVCHEHQHHDECGE